MSESTTLAVFGFLGVIIGATVQVFGNLLLNYSQNRSTNRQNKKRKKLLLYMLNDTRFLWRQIDTLKHVIGCDEEKTKQLLLEIGARGSEDSQELWGLINRNPFTE